MIRAATSSDSPVVPDSRKVFYLARVKQGSFGAPLIHKVRELALIAGSGAAFPTILEYKPLGGGLLGMLVGRIMLMDEFQPLSSSVPQ